MKKSKETTGRARQLRRVTTSGEGRLWNALRSRRLDGYKFRRQHPIGPFVVDFCCPEQALVVEIDGDVHARRGGRLTESAPKRSRQEVFL